MPNNCCCNHPAQFFCTELSSCQNTVQNPTLTGDYAFFTASAQTIDAESVIPLSLSLSEGKAISASSTTTGGVTLLPGTYELSYFVEASLADSDTASIALKLDGTLVSNSQVATTAEQGNIIPLSRTIILSVTSSGTVTLSNNANASLTIDSASLTVKKL